MLSIFIKKLIVKEIETTRGSAKKYTIIDDAGNYWDSWRDQWNADWKEGDTLSVSESQIKVREYMGKTYKTIAKPSAGGVRSDIRTSEIMAVLVNLSNKVDNLTNVSGEILKAVQAQKEINPEDLPF